MKRYDYHAARRTLLKPSARWPLSHFDRVVRARILAAPTPRDAARASVDVAADWAARSHHSMALLNKRAGRAFAAVRRQWLQERCG